MLMAYDLGQNCQQYENEINKSAAEQQERNEGSCGGNVEEKDSQRENEIGQDKITPERQREWGIHRGRGKKGALERCRS